MSALHESTFIRKVAVQTLDYDERVEYTVLYFTNDWRELTTLLAGPRAFYRNLQSEFPYAEGTDAKAQLPWRFSDGPVTAVIRNSLNRPEAGAKVFSIATDEPFEAFVDMTPGEQIMGAPESVHKGAFLAEFAIDTRTLLITYCPPRIPPEEPTYRGVYSRVNLALGSTATQPERNANRDMTRDYGSLHFDITQDVLARAQFVVSFIEDPHGVCNVLMEGARSAQRPLTVGNQTFASPGDRVAIAKPKPMMMKSGEKVEFMIHKEPSRRGTVILEGLDNNVSPSAGLKDLAAVPIGPPCTESIVYRNGNTYVIDTMIIKDYVRR